MKYQNCSFLVYRSPITESASSQSLGSLVNVGPSSTTSTGNKIDRKISLPVLPSNVIHKTAREVSVCACVHACVPNVDVS